MLSWRRLTCQSPLLIAGYVLILVTKVFLQFSLEPCPRCITSFMNEDHEAYPSRLEVDMDSNMLGSVKPYRRQVRSPFSLLSVRLLTLRLPRW